jgi:cytochrome o ubiquinol oxidase subunit 2
MNKKIKLILPVILALGLLAGGIWYLRDANFALLNPKGSIAHQERQLMLFASLLSLLVVVPVFALLFGIIWRYRVGNKKAVYKPDWDGSKTLETIWWLVPSVLIIVLSVVTWNSSHKLDPYKPLQSAAKPLKVQVVALDWKWLFIYPEQNIASVNFLEVPTDRPINFEITSDAPMNSLWIPQLGGQIYAMPGMSTALHLQADTVGDYKGYSANISGKGFAGMTFTTRAVEQGNFDQWVESARRSPLTLSQDAYNKLARPSENNKPVTYAAIQSGLYDTIIMKYMAMPAAGDTETQETNTHDHGAHDHKEYPMTNMQKMGM